LLREVERLRDRDMRRCEGGGSRPSTHEPGCTMPCTRGRGGPAYGRATPNLRPTPASSIHGVKVRLQLVACFAAEACAEAVRLINDVSGTSSIRTPAPLERYFRDAHTLAQHSSKSRRDTDLQGGSG